jgi:hypothetical protein
MDLAENIMRIKDNLFVIPKERFDKLVKDNEYSTSFFYLMACLIISVPIEIIVALADGMTIFETLVFIFMYLVLVPPFAYLVYAIQHLFLKLVGGQAGMLQSIQTFIYGGTCAIIFSSIPCLGLIPTFISLANVVQGSARVHKISTLRAILALVVIPIVVIIALVLVLFLLFGSLFGDLLI